MGLLGVAATLFVASCACLHTQPGLKIDAVHFKGNRNAGDATLLDGLHAQPVSCLPCDDAALFDAESLSGDALHVQSHLMALGYRDARVTAAVTPTADPQWTDVTFTIDEGAPTRIGQIVIQRVPGDRSPLPPADKLGVKVGDKLNMIDYRAGKEALRQWLKKRGYYHARVDGDIVLGEDRRAVITVSIDAGPKVYFGKTTVSGNQQVPSDDILVRVAWEEGDLYDPDLVELTQKRLLALGRLSSVRFDYNFPSVERPEIINTTLLVTEVKRYELHGGFGLAVNPVQSEGHVSGGFLVRGVFGLPMATLKVDGVVAEPFTVDPIHVPWKAEASVGGTLLYDDLVLPRLRGTVGADYSRQVTETYTLLGPRAHVGLDRAFLRDHLVVGIGWEGRSQTHSALPDAFDESPAVRHELGLDKPGDRYRVASYVQNVSYDHRDDPLETRSGYYLELHLQEGGRAAGSDFGFLKFVPDARVYVELSDSLVLALRARLGFGVGIYDDPIPITERFFAGGPNSQRGFAQQHLAPFVTSAAGDTAPIGGEALLESSAELRIDVTKLGSAPVQLVLFADAGNVPRARDRLFKETPHLALGTGLRLQTPVGPIRFDVARRVNRDGAGEPDPGDEWAFFFALGEAF